MNTSFAAHAATQQQSVDPRLNRKDLHTKHYLWYPAEHIPFPEVPGGFILRGQVTPVLDFPKWDKIDAVPEGMQKRTRADSQGILSEAQYDIPAQHIFEDVITKYGGWGVVELPILENASIDAVLALDIDRTFFPDGVPVTYREQEEAIRAKMRELRDSKHPQFATYESIALAMVDAIKRAKAYDTQFTDIVENNIELSKSHPGYQSTYCAPSLRALARLERERKDHAIIQNANRQNALVESLPLLIERLAPKGDGITSETFEKFAQIIGEQIKQGIAATQERPQPQQNQQPRKN